ncbi:MAG: DNA internalization-related competence protein ComEC/Rec2 [Gemmatimonadetes bacterium]|nr:DNA internalization-related competence protein ComEC/Rec2 [Gemmatimonadota bacterium]
MAVARALTIAGGEGVDPHLREAFVRAGVAHLLSISGFHVGVVASLLAAMATAAGLSPRGRAGVLAGGVWTYVVLIGAPTSAARAAWMTTALVLGTVRGWPVLRLGALGFAMLVLAVLEPLAVAGPGYQLTVAGTAGILVLGRWIARHWPRGGWVGALGPSVGAGLGAALFTAPVLALHFGALSTLSVPASLVLTPLVAVAIPGILLTVVLDLFTLPGAGLLAYATDGLLLGLSGSARALAALPWASIPVTARDVGVAVGSGLLALRVLRAPWRAAPWARVCLAVAGAGTGVVGVQLVADLSTRGTLEVAAIDVGQGDAIAIRTPNNRWYLVDGGPRSASCDAGASRVVPYLHGRGVRRIEAIVLSHPDADHVGGLPAVLEAFPVGAVLGPGRTVGQGPHLAALEAATRRRSPWRQVVTGDLWSRDGVRFRVLHPGEEDLGDHPNDWSVVLSVHFGEFDVLLMGDAEEAAEARVLKTLGDEAVEVLKVGHHGSRTSTTPALLVRVSPRVAMISAGRRNRYGHPAASVLRRLMERGATILRTDQAGTVAVIGRRDGSFRIRGSPR